MPARAASWLLALIVLAPGLLVAQSTPLQQAWALSDQARDLARSTTPQDAFPLYEAALELAPEEISIQRDYGIALSWAGEYRRAAGVLGRVRAAEPEQPAWARLEMANAELFGGEPLEAAALFQSLIDEGDLREPLLTRQALALRRARHGDEAAAAYKGALRHYPDSETAALGIVEGFLDKDNAEEAHAFMATWSEGRTRSHQMQAWRGWLLSLLGRWDEADQLFRGLPPDAFAQQAQIVGRGIQARLDLVPTVLIEHSAAATDGLQPATATLRNQLPGAETGRAFNIQGLALAAEGVTLARDGSLDMGVAYLQRAVAMAPTHLRIRRDYAIVLTWAGRYIEARREFDYVFEHEPSQPVWARSDRAQAELFGGDPATALEMLNDLLREGQIDERNLVRKGLALRWTGQSQEAERLYKQISALYPESSAGPDGLIQSLADQNRLGSAIKAANESLDRLPDHWDLVKSRAQVLNWAGRHLQAEKTLAKLPEEEAFQGDVLHHKALAARWSDDARAATEYARTFVQRHPGDRDAYRLREELAYQYGYVVRTSGDYFADTDQFVSQGLREEFEAPLSLRHRLEISANRQLFTQRGESAQWTTYGIGWTGQLSRRLSTHARAGQTFYSGGEHALRLNLDASASYLVSDRVRVRGGVGQEPTTAFRAVQRNLQTQYGYAEADFKPTLKTQVTMRAARTVFGGSTTRHGFDLSAFRRVVDKPTVRLRLGMRNGWIAHDQASPDVYSPSGLRTHLGIVHLEGRLPAEIDYVGEFGSGVQLESGSPSSMPFSSTIEIAKRLRQDLRLRLQAGYSNSALDRTNAGLYSYQMSYASVSLDYRLKREE